MVSSEKVCSRANRIGHWSICTPLNLASVEYCACLMPCVARVASSRPESSCHCLNSVPSMLQSWEPSRWREALSLPPFLEGAGGHDDFMGSERATVYRALDW
eukprot:2717393-Rhodomonas_salina.2